MAVGRNNVDRVCAADGRDVQIGQFTIDVLALEILSSDVERECASGEQERERRGGECPAQLQLRRGRAATLARIWLRKSGVAVYRFPATFRERLSCRRASASAEQDGQVR